MIRRRAPAARPGLILTFLLLFAPPTHAQQADPDWLLSYKEGLRLVQDGQPAAAIGHFQRSIELNPGGGPETYAAIRVASGLAGRNVRDVTLEMGLIRQAHEHLRQGRLFPAENLLKDLAANRFANPEVHLLLEELHIKNGRAEPGRHAGLVSKGLLDAILASGDGASLETAFLVQGINEEYLIVGRVLSCQATTRRVEFPPTGGVYDVFQVSCPDGARTMYFNVTAWGPNPDWRLKTYGAPQP